MAISTLTDRPPYNISRSVIINAIFIFATLAVAVAAIAADFVFLSKSWHMAIRNMAAGSVTWLADLQSFITFYWCLVALMLFGMLASVITLIWVIANRRLNPAVPALVQIFGIIMLVAPMVVGIPTVFSQLMAGTRMLELVKDFDIQLPAASIFYIQCVNVLTNPMNDAILLVLISPFAIMFILKEFFLKDKVVNYLLNAFGALCWLGVIIFSSVSILLPLMAIINRLSE